MPTVGGSDLYVGSCDGVFYALNAITGELRWQHDTSGDGPTNEFHTEPVVTTDLVITGSDLRERGATGHVYAFNRNNGTVRWKYDVPLGIAGSVLINGSNVYAMNFQQSLIGLDIASGKLVTSVGEATQNEIMFPASPVISNDKIFFAKRNGFIQALTKTDYRAIWTREISEQITSDLVIHGDFIFLATDAKKLYQISLNRGTITRTLATAGTVRWKILTTGSNLFFLEWDDKNIPALKCMNATTGKECWKQPSPVGAEWDTYRPLLWKDRIIVGSNRGHISVFDSSSGKLTAHTQVNCGVRMLGASDNFVYAGCSNGSLYALINLM